MRRASFRRSIWIFAAVFALTAVVAPVAQAANTAIQVPPVQLGTSGSSLNDHTNFFCCSGTLGSLVLYDGQPWILSNNHVLARSGSAAVGEHIIQPGLIESGCSGAGANWVATYQGNKVPLGHNVDTAIAQVRAGQVDPNGQILGIGSPCNSTSTPTVGMSVKKAGRTTGLTTGTIQATNLSVRIAYETACNGGRTFSETYTNQVDITPGTFSAGGDSGSLILSSTNHPVALLYAGSSQDTVANPIADVVNAYRAGGAHTFSFVGVACSTKEAPVLEGISSLEVELTAAVKERHELDLFALPGVMGVGVGRLDDEKALTEPAIIVYVDADRAAMPRNIPTEIDGVKVRVIAHDRWVAR